MKTKLTKNQIEIETSKIYLFNTLYGTKLETQVFSEKDNEWIFNGITFKEHFTKERLELIVDHDKYEIPDMERPIVYGIVRRVSPNGMNRQISLKTVNAKGVISDLTYYASIIIDNKKPTLDRLNHNVIRVSGAGMDMLFHTVYTLSSILFRDIEELQEADTGYLLDYRYI